MAERGSSPYINHFIQPDSIIPNPANPQSLNRYSYVQNNPIRYTDPTGHMLDDGRNEGGGGCIICDEDDESETPDIIITNNNGSNGPSCPPNHPNCEFGPKDCGIDSLVDCPAETNDGSDLLQNLPYNTTLHYFDTNNVNVRIPIYDFSTSPPTIIGYRHVYYEYDLDKHYFSLSGLWSSSGAPGNPTGLISPIYKASNSVYMTTKQIASLLFKSFGDDAVVAPLCPACVPIFNVSTTVTLANKVITFDAQLQVVDEYYYSATNTTNYYDSPNYFDLLSP